MNSEEERQINRLLSSIEWEEANTDERPSSAFARQLFADESNSEHIINSDDDDDGYGIVQKVSQEDEADYQQLKIYFVTP